MTRVVPISLGSALKVTLDNYYDLLKTQVGGLNADEFLQMKLVADPLDISSESYPYWSMYNLLERSDLGIEPSPVAGEIEVGAEELHRIYGRFLQRLRGYVLRRELEPEEHAAVADIDVELERVKDLASEYFEKEFTRWERYCTLRSVDLGDKSHYIQWSSRYGYLRQLEDLNRRERQLLFDRKSIIDRQYDDPEDREIIDAEFEFENPGMRLRYPIFPDSQYEDRDKFSLEWLAMLPLGSTGLYEDRRVIGWNVSVATMQGTVAGQFNASWDRNTAESSSIKTDWSTGASGTYYFIKANASASEQRAIEEDFKTSTQIGLEAKAAYKVTLQYPAWFQPHLFRHKRVKENIRDFEDFFGPDGTLLYYPTGILVVRGFGATFTNSQSWTYDYSRRFSASGGGGFNVGPISFGSKASYSSNVKEHKVDKAGTTLKFSDDESTLRFVGYVAKKNKVWDDIIAFSVIDELGNLRASANYQMKT
jgi:hypothetical protein